MKFLPALFCMILSQATTAQLSFQTTVNKHTQEIIQYIEVKKGLDNKSFAAGFVPDGVLFVKKDGKIFKAVTAQPNVYKGEWFGIKPDADSWQAWDNLKKIFPQNYPFTIQLQTGDYIVSKPVQFVKMPVQIIGAGNWGWTAYNTTIHFTGDGFTFLGCNGASLQNIKIRGGGKGRGMLISSVMNVKDVSVTHFNKGVEIYGDIYNGNKLDASRGRYQALSISNCNNGLRVVGGDANQSSFYDLDIRDIRDTGLIESSFLGNSYYSAHFINCKKIPFIVTDPNSVCTFYDVYGEMGMAPAKITKNTAIYGNRMWCGVEGGFVQRGTTANELIVGSVLLQDDGIKFWQDFGGTFNLIPKNGVWQFNYSNLDWTKVYLLKPGDTFRGKKIEVPSFAVELTGQVIELIKK